MLAELPANPRRAQWQLLMDGTAVESAFALLLTKVTKLAVSGANFLLPYPVDSSIERLTIKSQYQS